MNLALYTLCLPSLFGYLLFVGISGRLDPLSRPRALIERPSWMLGLWAGLSATLAMAASTRTLHSASPETVRALLAPGIWTLAALLLPGLIFWLAYRGRVARALDDEARGRRARSAERALVIAFPAPDEDAVLIDDEPHPLVATFRGIASPVRRVLPGPRPDEKAIDPVRESDGAIAGGVPTARRDAPSAPTAAAIADAIADAVDREIHETSVGAIEDEMGTLCLALSEEERARERTERHLQSTRETLSRLEEATREHAGDSVDALIALEEELESRIRECSAAELQRARERTRRIEAETRLVELKKSLLSARSDARHAAASKAKALSAANRSVALARQAVQTRERLEKRLHEVETTLADREATVGRLAVELEKEKNRTREEVGTLARQLMLQEKQLHARRDLEVVARNVEATLNTRLARKVARARPLVSDN